MKIRTQIFEYADTPISEGDLIEISENNIHHLRNVLRVKDGELIKVVINRSQEALASVEISKKQLFAKIINIKDIVLYTNPVSSLCFAFCKSSQNEFVCEKATELGIENLIFWKSEHTSIKIKELDEKLTRLNKIAEGAARQSKQDFLPNIVLMESLPSAVDYLRSEFENKKNLFLYTSLEDDVKPLSKVSSLFSKDDLAVHIFVGPEGGFSQNESKYMHEFAESVTLGNSVLKAETAAVVAIAQVQVLRGMA